MRLPTAAGTTPTKGATSSAGKTAKAAAATAAESAAAGGEIPKAARVTATGKHAQCEPERQVAPAHAGTSAPSPEED